jgi:hypothetical protein
MCNILFYNVIKKIFDHWIDLFYVKKISYQFRRATSSHGQEIIFSDVRQFQFKDCNIDKQKWLTSVISVQSIMKM